jgi:hypothetical protein
VARPVTALIGHRATGGGGLSIMTAGPCMSLVKIELISHDGAHGAYLRGVSEPAPAHRNVT